MPDEGIVHVPGLRPAIGLHVFEVSSLSARTYADQYVGMQWIGEAYVNDSEHQSDQIRSDVGGLAARFPGTGDCSRSCSGKTM